MRTAFVSHLYTGCRRRRWRRSFWHAISAVVLASAITSTTALAQTAPTITGQPSDRWTSVGRSVVFLASASGTPTPALQWQHMPNGSAIWSDLADGGSYSGVTTGTLTVSNLAITMNGDKFRMVASNSADSVASNAATLRVSLPPVGPALTLDGFNDVAVASGTVFPNSTALQSFTVEAWIYFIYPPNVGQSLHRVIAADDAWDLWLTYQATYPNWGVQMRVWDSNGTGIGQFEWRGVAPGQWNHVAGMFDAATRTFVIAINGVRSTTPYSFPGTQLYSGADMFSVGGFTPTSTLNFYRGEIDEVRVSDIVRYPSDFTPTHNFTLDANTRGLWHFNEPPGSTSFADSSGNGFTLTGYNGATTVSTSSESAPAITTHPTNQTVITGNNASFTVAASGTPAPTYQWQRLPSSSVTWSDLTNAGSYSGVTSTTLTVSATTTAMSGDQFRCVATNTVTSATSNPANLTVNAANVAPAITTQPASQTVTAGANATFTVAASGTPTPTYKWQRLPIGSVAWSDLTNTGSYSGVTTTTLTVSATTTAMNGDQFRCVATNTVTSATSNPATLTVNAANVAPAITTQPASQTATAGANATFTVAASGTPTPTYKWQRLPIGSVAWSDLTNTGSYSGVTTTTLTVSTTTTAMNGDQFRCMATNTVTSATSNPATLTVNVKPAVTTQPGTQTPALGQSALFSVVASGTAPLSYQWRKDGTEIGGATNATLTLTNVQATDAGLYSVVVTNAGGSTTSNNAKLVLDVAPSTAGLVFTTLAGSAGSPGNVDGAGSAARFSSPWGIGVDATGNLYVGDGANHSVRKITPAGVVSTLAGSGIRGGADGAAGTASFDAPSGIAVDQAGNVYVVNTDFSFLGLNTVMGHTVRKISASGVVSTLAGSNGVRGSTDGTGGAARFNFGNALSRDSASNLAFFFGGGLAVDGAGNLVVADHVNHTIRNVTAGGVVSTIAGLAGTAGGTDGPGSDARFDFAWGVAVDAAGNRYVADTNNHTIRKITPAGAVSTLAGQTNVVGSADGAAGDARFFLPAAVAVDGTGNVYVTDQNNETIRKLTPAGVVSTVAGLAGASGSADGAGSFARFHAPAGIAVDSAGNVYVVDSLNHTIRKGVPASSGNVGPTIASQPSNLTVTAGANATFTVAASGSGPLTYQWRLNGANIAGATSSTYTIPSNQRFHAGSYTVVVTSNGVSTTSNAAQLTVNASPSSDARLLNLSTRGLASAGANQLFPGFVVSGTGTKKLLIRAVGPSLGNLGVPFAVIPDPRMELKRYNFTTQRYEDLQANDDWQTNTNASEITDVSNQVFAFPLTNSKDAALLVTLGAGQYAVVGGDKNGTSGVAIVELYDADPDNPTTRLINISNRGFCGVGDQVMIPGFVVSAEGPKTFLLRVVGPTLADFGVPGTMPDPKLVIYQSVNGQNVELFSLDNWSDHPDSAYTSQIAAQVLAFALPPDSKDAALVATLAPGAYTVVGSSAVPGGTGIVLVEVYVVP